MSEKKSFFQLAKSLKPNFWWASSMELFERWAWYGMFSVLALYLTGSTDSGALGFSQIQKGQIMGIVTGILYFLPLIMGVIADKIGFKISLIIAFLILGSGYYMMGTVSTYTSVFVAFMFLAIGAALFKPVASGVITKSTNDENSKLGFGLFYMVVNIGGFVGPMMSSYLRTTYGWKLIFIQGTIVIALNLLIALFFFKEPKVEKEKESVGAAIISVFTNIWEAVKDVKLTVLLIIMIGFWTMFNQLFYTLPTFIEDWVDTMALHNSIAKFSPALANIMSGDGNSVNPEMMINIDAGAIVVFQILISMLVTNTRHVTAMIRGFIVAIIGIGLTFYFQNGWYVIVGIVVFALGEMTTNPTFSAFIASISPKGKEALYQGTYFLPVAAGNFLTTFISGNLYQSWSDKLSLLQRELAVRHIEMPKIGEHFTKNDYYKMAAEKLHMNQSQMTEMLWQSYEPHKIAYVIVAIGVVTCLALFIYDQTVIRPREKRDLAIKLEENPNVEDRF
ncbi:MFS transporter [Riemerella columbipharyngis]|uniref:Dipeptide/tripeptide permease n=1 Tax=Riemerella columbipharyngis TaxID=1071918 RepID=A0A1G7DMJ1_9FLAO|nr:MFS transporter [Riemerella columbipharyngis]SDE52035.1 Dipeptide/tripeptide permease [Riemerella columbipharyngis]